MEQTEFASFIKHYAKWLRRFQGSSDLSEGRGSRRAPAKDQEERSGSRGPDFNSVHYSEAVLEVLVSTPYPSNASMCH